MTTTSASPTSRATLPAGLRLGPVHLTVTDLDRSIPFYESAIGLQLARRDGSEAALGAGAEDLLVLTEERGARPAGRHAGLYHFALLHPSRLELARAAQRLIATQPPVSGASDHKISEAIYLPDPDGNGIELAADRSREHWGDLSDPTALGGPEPLDMQSLMALVDGSELQAHAAPELTVGHLHLHVGDIDDALAFWRDLIGFEVMTRFPSAAFIAAGGYGAGRASRPCRPAASACVTGRSCCRRPPTWRQCASGWPQRARRSRSATAVSSRATRGATRYS
jgi:catechol 2,3-dioxygenase